MRTESWPVGRGFLEVRDASVVDVAKADVYVSPDDNYLSHGGGASQAIWQAAGSALMADVAENRRTLALGDTFRTTGGALGTWVWHAVTLDLDKNRRLSVAEAQVLWGRVVNEVLDHLQDAAQRGYTRRRLVVAPLLGAGAGGLEPAATALALVRALARLVDLGKMGANLVLCARGTDYPRVVNVVREHIEEVHGLGGTRQDAPQVIQELGEGLMRLAEQAGAREDLHRLTLGKLLSESVRLRDAAGDPLPLSAIRALERAVEARNRLMHVTADVSWSGNGPLLADLRDGLAALRRELGSAELSVLFAAQMIVAEPTHEHYLVGSPRPRPTPRPSQVIPPEGAALAGIDPVRVLRDFLLARLPREALDDYVRSLRERGFVGEDGLCVLEACVVEEDPVGLICDLFTVRELRAHLQREYGLDLAARLRGPDAARELLRAMGFPVTGAGRGVEAARDLVARMRGDVPAASHLEIRGAVSRVASELEYIILVLLRFVAEVAFHEPADVLAKKRQWMQSSQLLDRISLGSLLDLLSRMNKALEAGEAPGIDEFRRNFRTERLAPEGSVGITQLRNRFAHFDRNLATLDLEKERRLARDFYDRVDAFLAHLVKDGQRVFPHLVIVDRIVVDRWGRRVVHAIGEREKPERLYTARDLAPGEVYFMHPLTNPLRVDPILVPAGDLGRPKRPDAGTS